VQTAQLIALIKDLLLASAAIVTATVAVLGLRKWRHELSGKVAFDVARGLAKATYRLRDEIQSARSPLVRGAEFPPEYHATALRSHDEEAQAWSFIYRRRWEPIANALQEFDAQALEAEALWGPDIRKLTDALRKCSHLLNISIEAVVEDKSVGGENFKADREFGKKMRADVHASVGAADNPLSQSIAAAVRDIESALRSHLSYARSGKQ
jgi:hypothetical protein